MAEIKPSEVRLYQVHGKGIVVTDENNFFIRDNGFINNDGDDYGLIGDHNKFMLVDLDNPDTTPNAGTSLSGKVGIYTDRVFQPGNTVQVKHRPEHGKLADYSAEVELVRVISRAEYDALVEKHEAGASSFKDAKKAIKSKYDSLVVAARKACEAELTKIRAEEKQKIEAIPRAQTLDTLLRQEFREGK